jgi:hypothetical protein
MQSSSAAAPHTLADENRGLVANTNGHQPSYSMLFSEQLTGMLALSQSLVAVADKRPGDVDAPLGHAAELAERTGEGNAYWMGFGPMNAGFWRLHVTLEAGYHEYAATIAGGLRPEVHPCRDCLAMYWVDYGGALARLRGRQDDAAPTTIWTPNAAPP